MKSNRFNTPATKSAVSLEAVDESPVTFDDKTGNIMYKDPEESWGLSKTGHCHIVEDQIALTGDGLLTKGEIGERNGLYCYGPTEFPVTIVQENGLEVVEHVRVYLGRDNGNLLVTNDGRFYLVNGLPSKVSYDREINTVKINQAISLMNLFNKRLGDMTELKSNKMTLVEAINELIERVNCPRRLLGYVEFLIFTDDEFEKFVPKDLDLCFNYQKKRFMYYSAALGKWTYLPEGWQKCTNVYRHEADMQFDDKSVLKVGETIGCLDTNRVWRWNGEIWTELAPLRNEIGDEFIVQYALLNGALKSLTVVYTGRGWVYTLR